MNFIRIDKDAAQSWGKLRYVELNSSFFLDSRGWSDIGVLHPYQKLDKIKSLKKITKELTEPSKRYEEKELKTINKSK